MVKRLIHLDSNLVGTLVSSQRFQELDLSSFKSVREFATKWLSSGLPCHILILNAGKGFCPKEITQDGHESIFGFPYRHLFIHMLQLRIIWVTSC